MTEPTSFRPQIHIGLPGTPPPAYTPPPRPRINEETPPKKYTTENVVAGEVLQNYTFRTPDEEGQYVKVVTHREHIELIKQPPTAEEIAERKQKEAERKAEEKRFLRIMGGVLGAVVVVFGALIWSDERRQQRADNERIQASNRKLGALKEDSSG